MVNDEKKNYVPASGPPLGSPLLTEQEAIRYLRLDVDGPRDPRSTLRYYRQRHKLRGARCGRRLRYPRSELDRLIERLLEGEK